jgi:hypothetical protein
MSEENYDVSVPCTHPELKKIKRQDEKCYSDFETDLTRRM